MDKLVFDFKLPSIQILLPHYSSLAPRAVPKASPRSVSTSAPQIHVSYIFATTTYIMQHDDNRLVVHWSRFRFRGRAEPKGPRQSIERVKTRGALDVFELKGQNEIVAETELELAREYEVFWRLFVKVMSCEGGITTPLVLSPNLR